MPLAEWSSLQAHIKFQESDIYGPFVQKASAFGQVTSMVHVAFQPDALLKVLSAPITELLSRTFESLPSSDDLTIRLSALKDTLGQQKGFSGIASGLAIENPNRLIVFIGWESIQVSGFEQNATE